MRLVLDASAVLSGIPFSGEHEYFISPCIERELSKGKVKRNLELMKWISLHVVSPSDASLSEVRSKAEESGDIKRVSKSDIEILALAKDLKATILTDDYSIQNLASMLGIDYRGILQKGIKEEVRWSYRCRKCGKFWEESFDECPVCGGRIRTVRV